MLILWAVNAIVLRWPIHLEQNPSFGEQWNGKPNNSLPASKADMLVNALSEAEPSQQSLTWDDESQAEKLRQMSVE